MAIRVGLQLRAPGGAYPCGAWILDLPGCFAWAADEPSALDAVPAAVRRYAAFLDRHGIAGPVEPYGPIEVVERFACFWSAPDYEVDPTFVVDEGAARGDDVAFARTVLLAARPELLAAAADAGAERRGDRTLDEVLHHVATAEWWYGTRLEERPDRLRAFGRFDEPDPRARLGAVRAWTLARLEALVELGPIERVHRGERWTPLKLLRRYVYHELDHLFELAARARTAVA